jgi:hypothetical protein
MFLLFLLLGSGSEINHSRSKQHRDVSALFRPAHSTPGVEPVWCTFWRSGSCSHHSSSMQFFSNWHYFLLNYPYNHGMGLDIFILPKMRPASTSRNLGMIETAKCCQEMYRYFKCKLSSKEVIFLLQFFQPCLCREKSRPCFDWSEATFFGFYI